MDYRFSLRHSFCLGLCFIASLEFCSGLFQPYLFQFLCVQCFQARLFGFKYVLVLLDGKAIVLGSLRLHFVVFVMGKVRVTVWNEYMHEKTDAEVAEVYPDGIHSVIAGYLRGQPGFEVRIATLEQPEHGLGEKVLNDTDVLVWWEHMAHEKVSDKVVDRIYHRVILGGDGLGRSPFRSLL